MSKEITIEVDLDELFDDDSMRKMALENMIQSKGEEEVMSWIEDTVEDSLFGEVQTEEGAREGMGKTVLKEAIVHLYDNPDVMEENNERSQ